MTEIARELLEDVSVGDYVCIRYGTDTNQDAVEGTILSWTENFLKLRKRDGGVAKVRLDNSLRGLDQQPPPPGSEPPAPPAPAAYQPAPAPAAPPAPAPAASAAPAPKPEPEPAPEPAPAPAPAELETAPAKPDGRVMRQMAEIPQDKQYQFDFTKWMSRLRALLKKSVNSPLKKEMGGVLDSFQVAVKNHEVNYKYHDLRAKIHNLWESCNSAADYDVFYTALGVLAITADDYAYAMEPLVRTKEYTLAAYAASKGGFLEYAEVFTLCALLSGTSENGVTLYVCRTCIQRHDPAVLSQLLEQYQEDNESVERLASCACAMFDASHGRLEEDITPYTGAYQAAKLLLQSIPPDWILPSQALRSWNEYRQYAYPAPVDEDACQETEQTGYISYFKTDKLYGFISSPPDDRFFHIKQVFDQSEEGLLLRKMLFLEQAIKLQVRYRLGTNNGDITKPAASEVELTEEGMREARERLEQGGVLTARRQGFIEHNGSDGGYSYIHSNGKSYKFRPSEEYVTDPYLRAYLVGCYEPQSQNVTFEAVGDKAFDICWLDPKAEDMEMYKGDVSEEEEKQWAKFSRNAQPEEELEEPAVDPYENFFYSPLPDWEVKDSRKSAPLTWNVERKATVVYAAPKLTPRGGGAPPVPTGSSFADKGRRAAIRGELEAAEQAFKQEIETNGASESVVADLTMLYMRQGSRIGDAVALLEEHGGCMSEEKLLNIKIQVYDKKKDYHALIPLYERSFQTALNTSKKSHSLVRLIDAQMKLGRYKDALQSCVRWEGFYQQNRFRSDAGKIKSAVPSIERHKAICYYHLGQLEAAKKIATDLIRSNPADAAANSILNGTLAGTAALEDDAALDNYAQEEDEDEGAAFDCDAGGSEKLMTRFVRDKLQQTDLATSLKSPYLKDGKYTGPARAALEDVEKLRRQRNLSASARSESLFAACKLYELYEQLTQREGGSGRNVYDKVRLAGRAMASWGDYMVSKVNQLDTTRMAYLFSLRVLTPNRNGTEQDWTNCFNRYVKSFFMARVGTNSLDDYISQQANAREKDPPNTDIFVDHQIPDVLLPEFLVGMLDLIDALDEQPDRQQALIEDLFQKNLALRLSVCQQMEAFMDGPISADRSLDNFTRAMHAGRNLLRQRMKNLSQTLVESGNLLMANPLPEELLASLEQPMWKCALTATDLTRLGQIHYALKRSQDYFCNGDFESRADCLRSAITEVKELLRVIQDEPTDVSYDIFLPALDQIHIRLADKQTSLYQDFQPKLSWEESLAPFRTPEGHVEIHLMVKNELNYQTADSLQVSRVTGGEVLWNDKVEMVPSLRGGEDAEVTIVVDINEAASQSGSFTVVLGCTYKCNDSPQNIITKNQEKEFTFVIQSENFEPLRNPFMAYEGKPMDDDSMFFGRSEQIEQIVKMLCPDGQDMNYGRAIAMYGQTRTGKSSLMYHLKKRLEEEYPERVVIWDIGNIGELSVGDPREYMATFLYHLLDVGSESLHENAALDAILTREGLEPPLDRILKTPNFAVNYFIAYMKKLNIILRRERRIVVLMADEFTYIHGYIREGKISTDFMRFWKALLQNYCVFAIVAGQDDMPEFMREYQNEFAFMELIKLTYLEERDAKRLIQEPLERINHREGLFRRDAVDLIYEMTAGSAYLTIILCSKLVSFLNEKGASQVTRGIVSDFLRTRAFGPKSFLTEVHFEAQLQERGHREYDEANKAILLSIARLSQTTGRADVNAIVCPGLSGEEIQRLVNRLVDRNVLAKEGRDQYWIQVKLLEKWLISTMGA